MDQKTFDTQVENLALALLYLTRFREPDIDCWRSWKGYDFDALNRLSNQDMIIDSRRRTKSVVLTDGGIKKAREILAELHLEDPWADKD